MSSPQPPVLLALHTDVHPDEYLIEIEQIMIGRAQMCQIVIPGKTISRVHAIIEREGARYLIRDANSANGTYVNGRRIYEPQLLKDQDVIGLGNPEALLRFEDADSTVQVPGQLQYDERGMLFLLDQKPLDLTPNQFRLLYHLYQHVGQVCSREACAEAIWGRAYNPDLDDDALDRVASNLRRQLREINSASDILQTRRGLGYALIL
jgi:DNA-binding response OmpR family regulator